MPYFPHRPALLGLVTPLLLVVLQTCTPISVSPEHATNRVGTTHTVTAKRVSGTDQWVAFFAVFAGPNEGLSSFCSGSDANNCEPDPNCQDIQCLFTNSGCMPADCTATGSESISWTYRSNGERGVDYISVCAINEDSFNEEPVLLTRVESQVHIAQTQEEIDADIAELESMGCEVVTKEWIGPEPTPTRRPNVGAIFAGPIGPAASPTPVLAAVAATTTVRPPGTGSGGLLP